VTRFWIGVTVVVLASIGSLWFGLSRYAQFDLTDAPDYDVADRYRLICGAYADVRIDPSRIPEELKSLIPLAAKYGHGNRVLLEDCVSKLPRDEAERIATEIAENASAIEKWVDRYPVSFNAEEVIAFRTLLEMRSLLRPIRIEPNKPVM
jgi:hypothetical protein